MLAAVVTIIKTAFPQPGSLSNALEMNSMQLGSHPSNGFTISFDDVTYPASHSDLQCSTNTVIEGVHHLVSGFRDQFSMSGNADLRDLSDRWISLPQDCVCLHANQRNHPNQNAGLNEVRVAAKHFGNRRCRPTNEQKEQEQNPTCPFAAYVLFRADPIV